MTVELEGAGGLPAAALRNERQLPGSVEQAGDSCCSSVAGYVPEACCLGHAQCPRPFGRGVGLQTRTLRLSGGGCHARKGARRAHVGSQTRKQPRCTRLLACFDHRLHPSRFTQAPSVLLVRARPSECATAGYQESRLRARPSECATAFSRKCRLRKSGAGTDHRLLSPRLLSFPLVREGFHRRRLLREVCHRRVVHPGGRQCGEPLLCWEFGGGGRLGFWMGLQGRFRCGAGRLGERWQYKSARRKASSRDGFNCVPKSTPRAGWETRNRGTTDATPRNGQQDLPVLAQCREIAGPTCDELEPAWAMTMQVERPVAMPNASTNGQGRPQTFQTSHRRYTSMLMHKSPAYRENIPADKETTWITHWMHPYCVASRTCHVQQIVLSRAPKIEQPVRAPRISECSKPCPS